MVADSAGDGVKRSGNSSYGSREEALNPFETPMSAVTIPSRYPTGVHETPRFHHAVAGALRAILPAGALDAARLTPVSRRGRSRPWPPDHDFTKRRRNRHEHPDRNRRKFVSIAMNVLQQVKPTATTINLYVRSALSNMAWGLKNLSVGVRATYVLLEQVQKNCGKQPGAPTMTFRRANGAWREREGKAKTSGIQRLLAAAHCRQ
jgi:hypothetical protein